MGEIDELIVRLARERNEAIAERDAARAALTNTLALLADITSCPKDIALTDHVRNLTARLGYAEEAIDFLRNHYSEVGARPCPACLYEEGKFIRLCKLHDTIHELTRIVKG